MKPTNMFASLCAVMRKELLDISRDRRTLALALLLGPVLYPTLMLGMGALAENRQKTQLDKVFEVPVVGAEHAPNLVEFLAGHGITATDPPADLDAAIAEQRIDVALEIDADFAENWRAGRPATVSLVHDSTRRNAEIPVARLRSALEGYASQVGILRLMARGIDPTVTRPVSVGISILSGRWMPVLVCFLSSSLRMSTRLPMGSTVSIFDVPLGLVSAMTNHKHGWRK